MDEAHEDVVKFAAVLILCVESRAEAGWIRCGLGIDELESIRPDGGVVESLGVLKMFGAEGSVGNYSGIIIMFFVMFSSALALEKTSQGHWGHSWMLATWHNCMSARWMWWT